MLERNGSTNSCKALFQRKKLVFKLKKVQIFAKIVINTFVKIWCTFLFTPFPFKSFNLFRQFSYTFRLSGLQFVGKNKVLFYFCEGATVFFCQLFRFNARIRVFRFGTYSTHVSCQKKLILCLFFCWGST